MKTKAIALILVILMMLCMVPAAVAETAVEPTQDEANGDIATSYVEPGNVTPPARAVAEPQAATVSPLANAKPDVPLTNANSSTNTKSAEMSQAAADILSSAPANSGSAATPYAASAARGGEMYIMPNVQNNGSLDSGSDFWMYYTYIGSDCDITAFLELPTAGMNYRLFVQVYDINGNLKYDEISDYAANVFGGQFVRLPAETDDLVILGVDSMDGVVNPANIYKVGVNTTYPQQKDAYEINDRFNVDNLYATSFGAPAISANLDNSYDSDWFVFSYAGTAQSAPAIEVTSSLNVTFDVYIVAGNMLQYVNSYSSANGKAVLPNPGGNAIFYVKLLSLQYATGNYSLNAFVDRAPITFVTITNISSAGDEGVNTYGYGAKPTSRYWTQGTFKALDQFGNPAAGVKVRVSFFAHNDGVQNYQDVITDANGNGSFNVSVFADYYSYTYDYRSAAGRWRVYYDNAEVWFDVYDANNNAPILSNNAFVPYYYWYGIQYMGS